LRFTPSFDSCLYQKPANRSHSAPIRLFLWVRPVENGANAFESNPHPRSPSFTDLRPQVNQHLFNIRPRYTGLSLENRLNDPPVLIHSPYGITA